MMLRDATPSVSRSTLLRVPMVTVPHAGGDALVRETVMQWIRSKAAAFNLVWDGGAITKPNLLIEIAEDSQTGRFAFSLWHRDTQDERKAWTVEAALTPSGGAVEIDVRLTCSHDSQDRGIVASVPRFLREIADEIGFMDAGRLLTPAPMRVVDTSESVASLVALVHNAQRALPVLAISEPEVVAIDEIATMLYPLAHVVRITREATYAITDTYGRASSAFNGAIRLYPSGWDMAEPPRERPGLFWLAEHIITGRVPFKTIAMRRIATELAALHESRQLVSPRSLLSEIARRDADRLLASVAVEREQSDTTDEAPVLSDIENAQNAEIERLREDNDLLQRQIAQARDDAAQARREAEEWEGLATAYEHERNEARARLLALGSGDIESLTAGLSEESGEIVNLLFHAVRSVRARLVVADGVQQDRDAVRAENDELRRAMFTLRSGHGNGATGESVEQQQASSRQAYPPDWRDYEALVHHMRTYYNECLVLHPRVRRTLSDGDPVNVAEMFEVIDAIGTDYYASKRGIRESYERFKERVKPYKYGRAVTDTGAGENREEYMVEWNGRNIAPEEIIHVRERGRDFSGRKFAIYFFYDAEREQVVITSMPRHRWTANART